MTQAKTKEEILFEYKNKVDAVISEMYKVLMRAQRKKDDEAYRKALKKL